MGSFTEVIDNIKTTLEGNTALTTFCTTKWGKVATVLKSYRYRTEIHIDELPVILITRPSLDKTQVALGSKMRNGDNLVRLYIGFKQDDRTKALDEMIGLEEKIDDALMVDPFRGGKAESTLPTQSANDEGPVNSIYFTVMEINIKHRRIP